MRRLAAAAGAALLLTLAAPAAAFVVEVTTSVNVEDADDSGRLKEALQSAVDTVLSEAIAFRPTLIVLTHAVVRGNKLYVRMLLADEAGEQTFNDLGPGHEAPAASVTEEPKICARRPATGRLVAVGYFRFRSASTRSDVPGWVARKPPLLPPVCWMSQFSVSIITWRECPVRSRIVAP
jgi:hypothetical protein